MNSVNVCSMGKYFECDIDNIPDIKNIIYKLYKLEFDYHYKCKDESYCFRLKNSPYTLKVVNTPDEVDPIAIEVLCRNPNTIEDIKIYTIYCNGCANITKFVTSLIYVYTYMFNNDESNIDDKIVSRCGNILINDNISPEDDIADNECKNSISDTILKELKEFAYIKYAIQDIASGNYNLTYKRS